MPETWGEITAIDLKSCQKPCRLQVIPPHQVPRACVLLAFTSFPSALWNGTPFPTTSSWDLKDSQVQASWSLVFFCVSSCLRLFWSLNPSVLARDFSLFQPGRLPRDEWGYFSQQCLWRLPQSCLNFAFLPWWFLLHSFVSLKDIFLYFEFWQYY